MKRTVRSGIGLLALAGLLATVAAAQSLGEYARQQRALKPATPAGAKVYTNDNLPTSGTISEVGQPAPPPPAPLSPRAAAAAERAEKQAAEERNKLEDEWRAKVTEQKKTVERLQRELDTLVRENRLRQTAYGSNINDQAQRSGEFAAANERYEAEIAEKQTGLDQAKQRLEDMKEELRKAGLPASLAE